MRAAVFSSAVNAHSISLGVSELSGWETIFIGDSPTFPFATSSSSEDADWLFFTEESSLGEALQGKVRGQFLPKSFPMDLYDDKLAFADWLANEPQLPLGICQWTLDQQGAATYPCLLKAKHSWRGAKKLPRGWLCSNPEDLTAAINLLEELDLDRNDFFLQKWLGNGARVISVCGFHDADTPERNLVAIVEKVATHREGLSCSAMVETVPDAWQLVPATQSILDALAFTGPFELEFIVGPEGVYVLELNPRFWMQHAIFFKAGNGLIKRYVGADTSDEWLNSHLDDVVWVDGLHLVRCLLTLNFHFLHLTICKALLGKKKVWLSRRLFPWLWWFGFE